eukprot:scaffold105806_cov60-Phaeocystis_antarctica.AAC.1
MCRGGGPGAGGAPHTDILLLPSALDPHAVGLPAVCLAAAQVEAEAHVLAAAGRIGGDAHACRARTGLGGLAEHARAGRGSGLEQHAECGRAAHDLLEGGGAAQPRAVGRRVEGDGRGEVAAAQRLQLRVHVRRRAAAVVGDERGRLGRGRRPRLGRLPDLVRGGRGRAWREGDVLGGQLRAVARGEGLELAQPDPPG